MFLEKCFQSIFVLKELSNGIFIVGREVICGVAHALQMFLYKLKFLPDSRILYVNLKTSFPENFTKQAATNVWFLFLIYNSVEY